MSSAESARPGFGKGYMIVLGTAVAAFVSVDQISNTMIPITCRHFTDSPLLIAVLMSFNRLFGFLVQPYVAWKSDRISTRFGRRRPFLMVGLPGTFLALLLLGAMPFLFEGSSRQEIGALIMLLVANVALQFFQDMSWGAQEPLYADTFPPKSLGRAVAIRGAGIQGVFLFMSYFALTWAETNEFIPYLCSAALVLVSLALVTFFVRERPFAPAVATERYNPVTHLSLLATNADYRKVATIGALGLMLFPVALFLFHPLFVTRTLGLTLTQLGESLACMQIVSILSAYPVGQLIDRCGPKWTMAVGFLVWAACSWALAFWVRDFAALMVVMGVFGAAYSALSFPMTPLVFQYTSAGERGTVFGLIQFVRGFTAFVFSLVAGTLVQFSSSPGPTPFAADEIREPVVMVNRIQEARGALMTELAGRLPMAGIEAVRSTDDTFALQRRLAAELNGLLDDENFYSAERFRDVELSRQSRRMIESREATSEAVRTLNRSLLQDAFAGEIAKQPDYRVPYLMSVVIALLGAALVLRTRPGAHLTEGEIEPKHGL